MATSDDTSKPRRSRRKHSTSTAVTPSAAPLGSGDPLTPPPPSPPRTLEEAVQNVRSLLMQVRATLHCLSDVLLYADDEDSVLHAEVAKALESWVNEATVMLDLVNLKPLIEALRQRGGGEPGEGGAEPASRGLYQVREPTLVYMA
ncbi:MAG TPA: hypothetical protein VGD45_30055 [Steroidobacter sp.]|uniref:hypothetical protein n=1 Tax=Steroidobacter sp. TaxID=1978227 RepID=UPI002EDA241B